MMKAKTALKAKRRVKPAAGICSLLFALLFTTPPALSEQPDIWKCEHANMPAEDVRACAALTATPGQSAKDRAHIYVMRGAAWIREEEPSPAIADFTRAIQADPTNTAAISGRARAYSMLGKHDLAAGDWSLIIAIRPEQSENYTQRGASRLAADQSTDALADFTRAVELDPGSPDAYVGRAKVYDHLNQRDKALKEFELAVGAEPSSWTTYLARAEAADRWGEKPLAIENYKLVLKYNGRYWNAHKALHRLGVNSPFGRD